MCGQSANFPYCDDSHKAFNTAHGTGFAPGTAALEGLPEADVLAPAFDAMVQKAAALLRDGLARARNVCTMVVGQRKRVALMWNHRSPVTAILGSHTLRHGMLVFPYLRRSVEGRALHAVCDEMRAAARRQDGHRTWWPLEVRFSMIVRLNCFDV